MISGLQLDRRRRRRPARAAGAGRPAPAEDAGLRRRRSTSASARSDPEAVADPLLRAARDPADRRRCRRRSRSTSRARSCGACRSPTSARSRYPARVRESYAQDLLAGARRRGDPRARLPDRRRLRLLGGSSFVLPLVLGPLGVEAVTAHALRRGRRRAAGAACARRSAQAKRLVLGGRRRPRRRLRPRRRAALPDRRAGARDPGRAGAAALPAPDRLERPARASVAFPITVTSQVEELVEGSRPRGRSARPPRCAELTKAAAEDGVDLRRRRRRRLRLPGVPARPTTRSRASASCSSCSRRSSGRSPSSSPSCRRATLVHRQLPCPWALRARSCAC